MTDKLTKKEKQLLEREQRQQEQLEKTRAALAARTARRKAAEQKKQRAEDARRKILLGAWLLSTGEHNQRIQELDAFLTRDADRELFGLPPQDQKKEVEADNSAE